MRDLEPPTTTTGRCDEMRWDASEPTQTSKQQPRISLSGSLSFYDGIDKPMQRNVLHKYSGRCCGVVVVVLVLMTMTPVVGYVQAPSFDHSLTSCSSVRSISRNSRTHDRSGGKMRTRSASLRSSRSPPAWKRCMISATTMATLGRLGARSERQPASELARPGSRSAVMLDSSRFSSSSSGTETVARFVASRIVVRWLAISRRMSTECLTAP